MILYFGNRSNWIKNGSLSAQFKSKSYPQYRRARYCSVSRSRSLTFNGSRRFSRTTFSDTPSRSSTIQVYSRNGYFS